MFEAGLQTYVKFKFIVSLINKPKKWHKIFLTKLKIFLTEQFQFQNATFQFLQVGADDAANRTKLCRFVFYTSNNAR